MRDAAKNGGGFAEFYFSKPGITGKLYSESIPGTGYSIGSAAYMPQAKMAEALAGKIGKHGVKS
jgi:hypothetical protein